jgi:hypothetical protein
MKKTFLFSLICLATVLTVASQSAFAQGKVYGTKPTSASLMPATKLQDYMGNKTRLGTVITGKIIKVTKTKGGWFEIDGGKGTIIQAHFKNYGVNLPANVDGHTAVIDGVAEKQFIADDGQHMAGDTATGKKQHMVKANAKNHITFEVTGMIVK